MMLKLYFHGPSFPRCITREEWKEIWRWKRVQERELEKQAEEQRQLYLRYKDFMSPKMKSDIMDQMINPPILVHDRMVP